MAVTIELPQHLVDRIDRVLPELAAGPLGRHLIVDRDLAVWVALAAGLDHVEDQLEEDRRAVSVSPARH